MSYSPALGFKPLTIEEIVDIYRKKWNELTEQSLDLLQFLGTNAYRVSFDYAKDLADLQSTQAKLIVDFFFFMQTTQEQINAGLGASYLGWENTFKDECIGLNLKQSSENAKLEVYFDTPNDENFVRFGQLFSKCVGAGILTEGTITNYFTDALGMSREVKYSKITEEDYINLDILIKYKIKDIGSPIVENDVKIKFIERFNENNRIGGIFYPDSFISSQDYPSVANFYIFSSLNGVDFEEIERDPSAGGKFKIGIINFERIQ